MTLARELGYIRHDLKIPGAYKSKRGEHIEPADFQRIRDYLRRKIESERDPDIRDKMVLLATYTGERSLALVSLRPDEVNFETGLVTKRRKGGKTEPIPYGKEALAILSTIAPARGYYFPHPDTTRTHIMSQNLRRYFQTLCKELGITLPSGDRPKIHSLRHSFLSEVANLPTGGSILVAATLAGHSSTKTTERYTHKNLQLARQEADKLH